MNFELSQRFAGIQPPLAHQIVRSFRREKKSEPALFRAPLSLKSDVVYGVTVNPLPGNSTKQTFKSYLNQL